MRPIPRRLLIHTVKLHSEVNADVWGDGELNEGLSIKWVRMEPSSKIVRDKSGAEIQLSATLFYDCKNSLPKGISFSVDNIITFNGERYKVKAAEPLYDGRRLHHYELRLVKDG